MGDVISNFSLLFFFSNVRGEDQASYGKHSICSITSNHCRPAGRAFSAKHLPLFMINYNCQIECFTGEVCVTRGMWESLIDRRHEEQERSHVLVTYAWREASCTVQQMFTLAALKQIYSQFSCHLFVLTKKPYYSEHSYVQSEIQDVTNFNFKCIF